MNFIKRSKFNTILFVDMGNENELSNKLDPSKLTENAKGATNEPKLIAMRYFRDIHNKEIIAYIGKGLAYHSGWYSLKRSSFIKTMKSDMADAAAVMGDIIAIAKKKI